MSTCRADGTHWSWTPTTRPRSRFWAGVLGWGVASEGVAVMPTDDTGFGLRFVRSEEPKVVQNRMHPDLTSSSPEDQRATVERALALGGRHVDIGQRADEETAIRSPRGGPKITTWGGPPLDSKPEFSVLPG